MGRINPELVARNEAVVAMFRQGVTLQNIGDKFKMTRERARQIIAAQGLSAKDGGQRRTSELKKARAAALKDARAMRVYGMSYDEVRVLRKAGLVKAYRQQKNNAENRAIDFELTLSEWYQVWLESGKLALRGVGKGHYCMSRIRDCGPYRVGNVHIQLCVENSRDAVDKWRGKTKEHRGVFNLYPGMLRPWKAVANGKSLGQFETQLEAVQAREFAIAFTQPHA